MRIVVLLLIGFLTLNALELPTSFSASFQQILTNPKKKRINYSGSIKFSKNNGIQWLYKKPTQKDVCSDKAQLVVVDHDLEQVSFYQLRQAINLEKIIAQAKLIEQNIYTAQYDGRQYTLKVDAKGQLSSIAYYDELENMVQIVFSPIHYSTKELSPSALECKIPPSYDIVNE